MCVVSDNEKHEISIVYQGSWEQYVSVTDDGNLLTQSDFDVIEVAHSYLHCTVCGHLAFSDYESHGIAEDWETL